MRSVVLGIVLGEVHNSQLVAVLPATRVTRAWSSTTDMLLPRIDFCRIAANGVPTLTHAGVAATDALVRLFPATCAEDEGSLRGVSMTASWCC
jgi:hypothetical protein